jgi:hypothetical protein
VGEENLGEGERNGRKTFQEIIFGNKTLTPFHMDATEAHITCVSYCRRWKLSIIYVLRGRYSQMLWTL